MAIETGTVKWFNEGKGIGFTAPDSGDKDLFAHFSEIKGSGLKTLSESQRVQLCGMAHAAAARSCSNALLVSPRVVIATVALAANIALSLRARWRTNGNRDA